MSLASSSMSDGPIGAQPVSPAAATAKTPKKRQTAALPDQIQAPEAR